MLTSKAFIARNKKRFLSELREFAGFPSISSDQGQKQNIRACAAWLTSHLRQIGMEHVQIIPTRGHPIVYADWMSRPGYPTVLFYGHYDVQPPGNLNDWRIPPFEPVVIGSNIYGRGVSDDKGQLFCHIKALEYFLTKCGSIPVNVRCIFEGEEEIGSPNLRQFLAKNREHLASDIAVISDTSIPAPDRPAITYSLRGSLGIELEVMGPGHGLHSGLYGGAVHNPLQALCEIISRLHDGDGRIAIPGFYDSVRELDFRERLYMAKAGPSDQEILSDAGVNIGWGESEYSLYERTTVRPSISVTSINCKTEGNAIPSKASARLDFRLVPDQAPEEAEVLLREYVKKMTPPTIKTGVSVKSSNCPTVTSRSHPFMRIAAEAYMRGFGKMPVFQRSGGTIPVVNIFQDILGIETVLMGFALPDDGAHGPNEKFHLPNFYKGISTIVHFLTGLAIPDGDVHDN